MERFCTAGAAEHATGAGGAVGSSAAFAPVQEHRISASPLLIGTVWVYGGSAPGTDEEHKLY
jgi:hypothetical protein